jgi:hypothetical protein
MEEKMPGDERKERISNVMRTIIFIILLGLLVSVFAMPAIRKCSRDRAYAPPSVFKAAVENSSAKERYV